ncbi:MAG: DUF192 domain-containing protein [Candidatus Magasanikbacteria bacterium]|nr:DUF192 domain-containing protein [Candidatus Magasanikbacteria bacterium]
MSQSISKSKLIFLLAFFGVAGFLFFWQRYHWPTARVVLKGEQLNVLVAKNYYQQYRGLGKRDSIAPYDGMIFSYLLEDKHGIVMREMRFPIDIVWFNNGVVVDIASNVPIEPGKHESELMRYYPRITANLILELPATWVDAHGLKIGDSLSVVEE